MTIKCINIKEAPKAIGPYSQAIACQFSKMLFLSGQIPICPIKNEIACEDVGGQTSQVLQNIDAILKSQSLSHKNVVKTTIFLSDMNNFSIVNELYESYFTDHKPARSCVEVARLPKDVLVEIECIAVFN